MPCVVYRVTPGENPLTHNLSEECEMHTLHEEMGLDQPPKLPDAIGSIASVM